MKVITLKHKRQPLSVLVADTWLSRLVGLLRYNRIDNSTGLWLLPCGSIHTMWMRFSIDAVYLDECGKILKIKENIKPFRFDFAPEGTSSVLEVAANNAKQLGFSVNETLDLKH